jgi:hypothetical protein
MRNQKIIQNVFVGASLVFVLGACVEDQAPPEPQDNAPVCDPRFSGVCPTSDMVRRCQSQLQRLVQICSATGEQPWADPMGGCYDVQVHEIPIFETCIAGGGTCQQINACLDLMVEGEVW